MDAIRIAGARTHNLKDISLDLPKGRITVLTGPSGSGKSSLAFDTLFAEGQRRYVETLSPYVRQFLDMLPRPDVDSIEGLPPTVALGQQGGSRSPRSTVASLTEILDFLRILYARAGEPHCPKCRGPIRRLDPSQIVADLLARGAGARAQVLAPLVRGRRGDCREVLSTARGERFLRVRVDGKVVDLEKTTALARNRSHDVEAVVDRLRIGPEAEDRLRDSVAAALKLTGGVVLVSVEQGDEFRDLFFSEISTCPRCRLSFEEITPQTFSFNNPQGACPRCEGLGERFEFDPDLVLPDPGQSLAGGALAPSRPPRPGRPGFLEGIEVEFASGFHVSRLDPIRLWPQALQRIFLHGTDRNAEGGTGDRERRAKGPSTGGSEPTDEERFGRTFPGVIALLQGQYEKGRAAARRRLEAFMSPLPCRACGGGRLRPEAAAVKFGGRSLPEVLRMSVAEAAAFFAGAAPPPASAAAAGPLLGEIRARLQFLLEMGLDYLSLSRTADTLSSGEHQRVRLGHHVGSGLSGVLYVLDEPTIGLHPRDHERLLGVLRRLRDLGNTLLVVEHEADVMRAADFLVDLGPGAGPEGGRIMAMGTPAQVAAAPDSPTGRYLSGAQRIDLPEGRREGAGRLVLSGASGANLKGMTLAFPLRAFTCVTGVSGAGKSSLVFRTLRPALRRLLHGAAERALPYERLKGAEGLEEVVEIGPSPLGRTPRSNPATFTDLMSPLREVFASLTEAKIRGFGPRHFSFNARGGRCEACEGQGVRRIEMRLLPDLYVVCDACKGARFQRAILGVKYRGKSVSDVLSMTVSQARDLFRRHPRIAPILRGLEEVGLGYLALGQSSLTLSGGEAERLKLAAELFKGARGPTLYLLDEPTTGLHFEDVRRLLDVLHRLVDAGHTVLVIEHHLDVVKTADFVVDLGPEGGEGGGRVVAQGPPEAIAACPDSRTGRFLREVLRGPGPRG